MAGRPSTSGKGGKTPIVMVGDKEKLELIENRRKQDFFIKPKYQNTLPDIPCDPKHLLIPPDLKNFQLTFTELRPLYEQITDWNVGVAVDLVGKTFDFTLPKDSKCPEDELHPVDKLLLQPEVDEDNNDLKARMMRNKIHQIKVPWLRRTEYIAHDSGSTYNTKQRDPLEYRMGKAVVRKIKSEATKFEGLTNLSDKGARINWIEKSFDEANKPIDKHYSNPGVVPVEIVPVFPDFELWTQCFIQTVFDPAPSVPGNAGTLNENQMNQALLHVLQDDNEEQIGNEKLGYFVPTQCENESSSSSLSSELTQEFQFARDYVFKTMLYNPMNVSESYVFLEKENSLTYCGISRSINLHRCPKTDHLLRTAKLYVNYRPLTQTEINEQKKRRKILQLLDADKNEQGAGSNCIKNGNVEIRSECNANPIKTETI